MTIPGPCAKCDYQSPCSVGFISQCVELETNDHYEALRAYYESKIDRSQQWPNTREDCGDDTIHAG